MQREEAPTKGLPQATTNLSSLVENVQRKRVFLNENEQMKNVEGSHLMALFYCLKIRCSCSFE